MVSYGARDRLTVLNIAVAFVFALGFLPLGYTYPYVARDLPNIVTGQSGVILSTIDLVAAAVNYTASSDLIIFYEIGAAPTTSYTFKKKYTRTFTTTTITTKKPKHVRTSPATTRKTKWVDTDGLGTKSTSAGPASPTSVELQELATPEPRAPNGSISSSEDLTTSTISTTKPYFYTTPTEFLTTPVWTTPSAPPCTDGPQPSITTTIRFDDIKVTWWYALLPTGYAGLHLRNTHVIDETIVDEDWDQLAHSKPNFAVHPGSQLEAMPQSESDLGAVDDSGFIALPDGGTFDLLSLWIQCQEACEIHFYQMEYDWTERELFTDPTVEPYSKDGRLILPGGLKNIPMRLLNLEKTYGSGAGKKVRWIRYWAQAMNLADVWTSLGREIAVGLDDLVIVRRANGTGCAEPRLKF